MASWISLIFVYLYDKLSKNKEKSEVICILNFECCEEKSNLAINWTTET